MLATAVRRGRRPARTANDTPSAAPRAAGHAAAPDPCPHQRACRQSAGHPGLRARTRHQGRGTTAARGFAIIWLHLDSDHLTGARHCVACQPYEPVIDVSCSGCGDGPLITGQPPRTRRPTRGASAGLAALPRLATPPRAAMPRRPEIAASIKSPCAMMLRILHQSSSQAMLAGNRGRGHPCLPGIPD
jgi:hypothetical protein